MITDQEIQLLFDDFLAAPELASWESDLSGREREDAQRLFREAILTAIKMNEL